MILKKASTDDDDITSLPGRPEMLSKFEKLWTESAPVQEAVPSDTSKLNSFEIHPFLTGAIRSSYSLVLMKQEMLEINPCKLTTSRKGKIVSGIIFGM